MRLFQTVDMRGGNPVSQIVRFSIPMLLGNIAQQLYNTVDSIIVGRFVGDNALAAVGSAGPILNLMIVLFIGISTGASIMVSQYFGAQRKEDLAKAVGSCITLTGVASLLIMIVGPLVAGPLLRLHQDYRLLLQKKRVQNRPASRILLREAPDGMILAGYNQELFLV